MFYGNLFRRWDEGKRSVLPPTGALGKRTRRVKHAHIRYGVIIKALKM